VFLVTIRGELMIYTELKNWEEIKNLLEKENDIFLLGCNGCAEVCETGGEKVLQQVKEKLAKDGKNIAGTLSIDFLCNKTLIVKRLHRQVSDWQKATCFLVFSCGIGVQCAAAVTSKPVYPATNTISLGGFQGLWPGQERCAQCGSCYLGITGGICPITYCAKELVNGPCGGAKNGKCEIKTDKDCGWALIYERLKKTGKWEQLRELQTPRNYKKMEPGPDLRKNIHFSIDLANKGSLQKG